MRTRIALGLLLALALLGMVFLKVHLAGAREYRAARAQIEAGNLWDAVHALDRVLHWYTPISGHVGAAARDLWQIGQEAESRGDAELALAAYRTLRSGFYAARSFYTPGKDWIARADGRIVELVAAQPDFSRRYADRTEEERRAIVALSLAKDRAPDVLWSLVVEVGFLGWVGSTVGFIWLVLGSPAGWRRRPAALWGTLVAGFYALWVVGMMRA